MKKIIILLSALILCAPVLTCTDLPTQAVKLNIYYSADGFTGFYVADAGSPVLLDVPLGVSSGPAGIYSVDIAMATNLKVQIASKSVTNTMTVLIYNNGLLVKEGTSAGTGIVGVYPSVSLLYEYDASKTTTTTTSTTTK